MSSRLGHVAYDTDNENQFTKPFSEVTSRIIDEEVGKMVSEAYERSLALIEEKKELVEKLALKLLEVETINHDLLIEILGQRPFQTDSYRDYLTHALDKAIPKKDKKADDKSKDDPEEGTPLLSPAPA